MKRICSLLCAAMLGLSGIAAASPAELTAFAEEEVPTSGTCGENLTWEFDTATGTLTISGEGEMENWAKPADVPWNVYCDNIISVKLADGVTSIGDRAFYKCLFTEFSIPDSVTSIGVSSFFNCMKLTGISIPDSVTNIGETAFGGCTSMTELTISNNVTSIREGAFHYCAGLIEITVPKSVTSIGRVAFYNCLNLDSITIMNPDCEIYDAENTLCRVYKKENGKEELLPQGTIYGYAGSTAEAYAKKYGCTFETLGAAPEQPAPTSGTCGENLTWEFDTATGTLTIAGSGKMDDFSEDPCGPWKEFQGAIKIINLSDGVTSIGSEAFGGCNGLTEITIPENVKSVGEKAFMLCTNLERIMFMNADCEIFDQDNTISNSLEASPDSDAPRYIYTGSISGYGGSTAEAYARKYKRAFRTLGAVPVEKRDDADLNKDGRVSVADVVMFARSLSETQNAMPIPAGLDLNGDGLITLLDLRELLRTL